MSLDSTVNTSPATSRSGIAEDPAGTPSNAISRRGFLRVAGLTGGGLMVASVAACQAATPPTWSFGAPATPGAATTPSATPSAAASATPAASASAAPSASASPNPNLPTGWTAHDINARNVVRRYLGNLVPALKGIYGDAAFAKLADILGAADNYCSQHLGFVMQQLKGTYVRIVKWGSSNKESV